MPNPLAEYFEANQGRVIHKWPHYFDAYHRHLARFQGQSPVVLEVGVSHGGSLHMWRDYFGAGARIIGVDANPACAELRGDGFEVFIGDQASRETWADLRKQLPPLDVVVEDGGHRMDQQRVTFDELFPYVKDGGVYICEDTLTSYMPDWGGGGDDSFMEYAKGLVDALNGWWAEENYLTRTMCSLHFYPAMVVVERGEREQPTTRKTGSRTLG